MTELATRAGTWILAAASTPTPTPSPSVKIPDASQVSPGLGGFLIVFFLAIAVIFLTRGMTKRIRRVKVRGEAQDAAAAAEAAENEAAENEAADPSAGSDGVTVPPSGQKPGKPDEPPSGTRSH